MIRSTRTLYPKKAISSSYECNLRCTNHFYEGHSQILDTYLRCLLVVNMGNCTLKSYKF